METLTLEINNPATLKEIAAAAAQRGLTAKAYALDLLESALHHPTNINGAATVPAINLEQFKADLEAFSEGTENLPATPLTYNREDIYFDHD